MDIDGPASLYFEKPHYLLLFSATVVQDLPNMQNDYIQSSESREVLLLVLVLLPRERESMLNQ